jgi:hypothetical protein
MKLTMHICKSAQTPICDYVKGFRIYTCHLSLILEDQNGYAAVTTLNVYSPLYKLCGQGKEMLQLQSSSKGRHTVCIGRQKTWGATKRQFQYARRWRTWRLERQYIRRWLWRWFLIPVETWPGLTQFGPNDCGGMQLWSKRALGGKTMTFMLSAHTATAGGFLHGLYPPADDIAIMHKISYNAPHSRHAYWATPDSLTWRMYNGRETLRSCCSNIHPHADYKVYSHHLVT